MPDGEYIAVLRSQWFGMLVIADLIERSFRSSHCDGHLYGGFADSSMALKIGVYNPSSSKKANVVDETMSSSEVVESGLGRGFPSSRLNTFPQRSTSLLSSPQPRPSNIGTASQPLFSHHGYQSDWQSGEHGMQLV